MTDEVHVVVARRGEPIRTSFGPRMPMLALRCKGNTFEIVVGFEFVVHADLDDEVLVKRRFDKGVPVDEYWEVSTNRTGAFSQDPRALLASMRSASVFRLQVQEALGGTQVASFSLTGLSAHLPKMPCATAAPATSF